MPGARNALNLTIENNAQLGLRQFLKAQTYCCKSAKHMVSQICEAELLAAARSLTGGARPELAAACAALLTTDSTDDDHVTRSPEFTALVQLLSPIVIATPPASEPCL